ncbi:hypothetical protein [Amantichitinum ursilacus]|uniref:DUF600 family protein n=1 Tax=Amantichitinum ursilacus TaxID=857265 RepID=A0A0N0XKD5_9NEIS|nr:hypothetical protein [Amantichitinum ursilacus]KPC53161.1 hypothetical protein WG78_08725 [Amantichitinum ursilacus]
MISRDIEICQAISSLAYAAAPTQVRELVVAIVLDDDAQSATLEYDYVDEEGKSSYFLGGAKLNDSVFNLFTELRQFFIEQGQPAWQGCKIFADVTNSKFKLDVFYSE